MTGFTHSLAIVIGIDAYRSGIPHLTTAVNDATRLAELLTAQHGYDTLLLTAPAAGAPVTQERLHRLFTEDLPARLEADDRLLVYFAGHGVALDGDDGPRGYLVPQDARPGDSTSMLAMTDLHAWLTALPCRHMLAILDCCFAGAFRWAATRHLGALPDVIHQERYDRYLRSPAWQVLTSASYDQRALDVLDGKAIGVRESDGKRHSPFAQALIAALAQGAADLVPKGQGDGVITATELYLYLREQVEVQAEAQARHEQTPGLWPLNKHRRGEFIFLVPGHPLNLPPAPDLTEEANPYRGLKSYDQKHAPLFFGREDEINDLVQRVDRQPFVAVLGASGTGKSSLVKAGLLPRLAVRSDDFSRPVPAEAAEAATTKAPYRVLPPMRPTDRPIQALAALLCAELGADLSGLEDLTGLSVVIARWAGTHPGQRLVLTIDQFEELATLCRDDAERARFLRLLAAAVAQQPEVFRLIVTLRTDFEPQFTQEGSPLAEAWKPARYVVPPMDIEDLRQVIEGPASVRVLYFDPPELVDDLIKEVVQTPGALPLLSFTLSEMYIRYVRAGRDDRSLCQADYDALGGVVGSLRNRATEEYDALPDDAHRRTMQQAMLRMVAVEGGELARRRVALSELEYPTAEENTRVGTVLDRLVEARLLVRGTADQPDGAQGEAYVEPAHDALVLAWDRLLRWKQEAEEYLPLQRRLAQAATEWRQAQPAAKSGLLWDDDPRLPQVEETLWPTGGKQKGLAGRFRWARQVLWPRTTAPADTKWLNGAELGFVQASVTRRAMTLKRVVGITAIVIIALVGLTLFANAQRLSAVTQASRAKVGELTAQAKVSLDSDPELSILLARSALQTALSLDEAASTMTATDTLREALIASRIKKRINFGVTQDLQAAAFNDDKSQFAIARKGGEVLLYRMIDGALVATFEAGTNTCITDLAFSPQSPTYLGITGYRSDADCGRNSQPVGGLIRIWNIVSQDEVFSVEFQEPAIDLDFKPDLPLVVVAIRPSEVQLWNIETGTRVTSQHIFSFVVRPTFSTTGDKLAIIGSDHLNADNDPVFDEISVWDYQLRTELVRWRATQDDEIIQGAVFGPGDKMAVIDDQGTVSIWDLSDIRSPRPLGSPQIVHEGIVFDAIFSPNGACVGSVGFSDHSADILTDPDAEPVTLLGHKEKVVALAFLTPSPGLDSSLVPCGTDMVATISADGMTLIWNIGPAYEYQALVAHSKPVTQIAFSPDHKGERYLVTGSEDGTAQIWSVESFRRLGSTNPGQGIEDVDFSPDGEMFVTAGMDGTAKLWQTSSLTLRLPPIKGQQGPIYTAAFRPPAGEQIATGGSDGSAQLWNSRTGEPIVEDYWHLSTAVNSIDFNNDGTRMIVGSADGVSHIVNLVSREVITLPIAVSDVVYDAVLGSDDRDAFTASSDGAVRRWQIDAARSSYQRDIDSYLIEQHQGAAYSIDLDPSENLIASSGDDGKVYICDIRTGKRVGTLSGMNVPIMSVRFSPDGQFLATGDDNGIVRIYYVRSDDLFKLAALRTTREFTPDECEQYDIQTECH